MFRLPVAQTLIIAPEGRWHSAAVGAALSAHLTLALQPMTLQELLLAGGKRGEGLNGLPGALGGCLGEMPGESGKALGRLWNTGDVLE